MRNSLILLIVTLTIPVFAEIPTRYYVGKTEVSESFWNQMPDSLAYVTSESNYDTLIVRDRELPLTHYIDSVSVPGKYLLCKRTPEVVAELEHAYAMINRAQRERCLSSSIGEPAPQISLVKYENEEEVNGLIMPGNCYLLSFWAVWCGNCLFELKPEFIPSVAEQFNNNSSFHFIPICIDATSDDLRNFFVGKSGCRWAYLAGITYLDIDRKANEQYGVSGILPLNIVIGKDGLIRYIHSGAIADKEGLSALYEAIRSGL